MAYVKHRGYATALRRRFPGASAYADQRLRFRLVDWKRARFLGPPWWVAQTRSSGWA